MSNEAIINQVYHAEFSDLCARVGDSSVDMILCDLQHSLDFLTNPFPMAVYIGFPKTQNYVSVFLEVSVLGFIDYHSAFLAFIQSWKFFRVSVPVIAIKLNNEVNGWDISIDNELVRYRMLCNIFDTNFIQKRVTCLFKFVRGNLLLFYIQLKQIFTYFGVIVTTGYRAVFRVIVHKSGRGQENTFIAGFANKLNLVFTLLLICTCSRTKTSIDSTFRDVKRRFANFANFIHSSFFRDGLTCLSTAFIRTKTSWSKKRFTTIWAIMILTTIGNSTFSGHFLSYLYTTILTQIAYIQKPIILFEYVELARKRLQDADVDKPTQVSDTTQQLSLELFRSAEDD